MRLKYSLLAFSLMSLSFFTLADDFEALDAHVHGVAQLQIVSEDNTLAMHFESPAMNIVGFEHNVRNEDEAEKLQESISMLSDMDDLFLFSGGKCSFVGIAIENPFEEANDHHKHEDEEHEHHHDHDTLEHREFTVEYKATCQDISELTRINLPLFDMFGRIESLDIQYILRGKQGAVLLTRNKPFFDLPK